MADDVDYPKKTYRLTQKEIVRANDPANIGSPDPNDVHAILQSNLSAANQAGLNDVSLPPKRLSRRRRDYIIVMILGNLALVFGTVISPVFGVAGLVIFNVGLTWVMWFVMDDQ